MVASQGSQQGGEKNQSIFLCHSPLYYNSIFRVYDGDTRHQDRYKRYKMHLLVHSLLEKEVRKNGW